MYAAQANIAHCVINAIYNGINGGFGTVTAIVSEQPTLKIHAKNSKQNRNGQTLKSRLAKCQASPIHINIKEFFPQFREWLPVLRNPSYGQ